jgi:hypothetical protein
VDAFAHWVGPAWQPLFAQVPTVPGAKYSVHSSLQVGAEVPALAQPLDEPLLEPLDEPPLDEPLLDEPLLDPAPAPLSSGDSDPAAGVALAVPPCGPPSGFALGELHPARVRLTAPTKHLTLPTNLPDMEVSIPRRR